MVQSEEIAATWSRYWNSGQTESCPDASVNIAPIDAEWRAYFARLPSDALVLDLATGGAHVLRLAIEVSGKLGRSFGLRGVDLADLSAVTRSCPAPAQLMGNVDLASLPFANATFDAVVSQFGVEYAAGSSAYYEALRVLKPNGSGQFILHHRHSIIVRNACEKLCVYQSVFPDDAPFQQAQNLFRTLGDGNHAAASLVVEFRETVADVSARLRDCAPSRDLELLVRFLRDLAREPNRYIAREVNRRISIVWEELRSWQLRQRSLVDCALDQAGMEQVTAMLREAGADRVTVSEIQSNPSILGWCCTFRKSA